MATAPQVECERHHAVLSVADLRAALEFYTTRLGFTEGWVWGEPPTMAAVSLGKVQLYLHQGTPGPDGIEVYFVVGDADELYEFQRGNGVEVDMPPGDREYGLRDYSVRDLYGYRLTFAHKLEGSD